MKKKIFNRDQMEQIHIGLVQGLDISKYTQLDPNGHPIYDFCQMEQIREGIKQGLDVSKPTQLVSKSSLSDFDKTPTDLQDSKVINEYNKSHSQPNQNKTSESKNINRCI
ncbi:hypothetical protein ACP0A6_02090 [Metamycoplasma hominis]|uniref:hypothetical protein n=1 Tax=Metamycoplasma hominis TaxID=2098 RepID=UPI003CEFF139